MIYRSDRQETHEFPLSLCARSYYVWNFIQSLAHTLDANESISNFIGRRGSRSMRHTHICTLYTHKKIGAEKAPAAVAQNLQLRLGHSRTLMLYQSANISEKYRRCRSYMCVCCIDSCYIHIIPLAFNRISVTVLSYAIFREPNWSRYTYIIVYYTGPRKAFTRGYLCFYSLCVCIYKRAPPRKRLLYQRRNSTEARVTWFISQDMHVFVLYIRKQKQRRTQTHTDTRYMSDAESAICQFSQPIPDRFELLYTPAEI